MELQKIDFPIDSGSKTKEVIFYNNGEKIGTLSIRPTIWFKGSVAKSIKVFLMTNKITPRWLRSMTAGHNHLASLCFFTYKVFKKWQKILYSTLTENKR